MSDDRVWSPCPLCRSGVFSVQRSHWRAFESAAKLEAHLKENLSKADVENGTIRAIVNDWRVQDRFRSMERQACRDPMKSVQKMFEEQFGSRERHHSSR